MKICYNKLQKLMIDNQMKRQDLMRAAEITSYAASQICFSNPIFALLLDAINISSYKIKYTIIHNFLLLI